MKLNKKILMVLASCVILLSCGGRVPSAKTAKSVSEHYFKRYGGKFKTTEFAHKNVTKVEINGIEEISHNNAQVDAFVDLKDGKVIRTLLKMEKKFPQGWQVESWEVLDRQ